MIHSLESPFLSPTLCNIFYKRNVSVHHRQTVWICLCLGKIIQFHSDYLLSNKLLVAGDFFLNPSLMYKLQPWQLWHEQSCPTSSMRQRDSCPNSLYDHLFTPLITIICSNHSPELSGAASMPAHESRKASKPKGYWLIRYLSTTCNTFYITG